MIKIEPSLLSQLWDLDKQYMKYAWSLESWQDWLHYSGGHKFLAVVFWQDEIVGFSLWQWASEGEAELHKLVIQQKFQGQGVANSFCLATLVKLKDEGPRVVLLEVEELNLRAINFYKKLGFIVLGKRKSFYSDGANALSLKLQF